MSRPDNFLQVCPYKSSLVLFIYIKQGKFRQENTVTGKREVLRERGGQLFVVWPGEWSTSARLLTNSDRRDVLAKIA